MTWNFCDPTWQKKHSGNPHNKEVCKRGHKRTPENVGAGRHCLACERLRHSVRWRSDEEYRKKTKQRLKAAYLRRKARALTLGRLERGK